MSSVVRRGRRVVVVGWDGGDWDIVQGLVAKGWMANLGRLLKVGVSGRVRLAAPAEAGVGEVGWVTMMTGVSPVEHGVLGEMQMRVDETGVEPVGSVMRRRAMVWEWLERQGVECVAVNFPATHPVGTSKGMAVSDRFVEGEEGSVWPREMEGEMMSGVRVRPEQIDAASLLSFVPRAREVAGKDVRLNQVAELLARTATVHAAATVGLAEESWAFAAVRYAELGRFQGEFLAESGVFGEVVAGAYRFHDLMLGRVMELAGPGAVVMVVSTPSVEKEGMVVVGGAGISAGRAGRIAVEDVAPTVLGMFGFGRAAGMRGRVWEAVGVRGELRELEGTGVWWRGEAGGQARAELPSAAVEYLESLGYSMVEDQEARLARERLEAERRHLAARLNLADGRAELAVGGLEDLVASYPMEEGYGVTLAEAYAALGLGTKLEVLVVRLMRRKPETALGALGMAVTRMIQDDSAGAAEWLGKAESAGDVSAWIMSEIGRVRVELQDWEGALRAYRGALAMEGGSGVGSLGLARVERRNGNAAAAVVEARRAMELLGDKAAAKELGLSLAAAGEEMALARELLESVKGESAEVLEGLERVYRALGEHERAAEAGRAAFKLRGMERTRGGITFDMVLRRGG